MTKSVLTKYVLLAFEYYNQELKRIAHALSFVSYELLLLTSVTLLVIATIVWQTVSRRRRRAFAYDSSPRLFADLCRTHKLSRTHRRLLKHLAAARGLRYPAELFVEPEHFEMLNLPASFSHSADELEHLRHKLFD